MRSVPADLLAKLYEKMQTKGMNADPRIYLVFHRSERYIEEGGLLAPQNVLTAPPATDLGSWDMALRRDPELYKTYPSHIYRAHVDNGSAEVTRIAYDNMLNAMTNDEVEVDDLSWEDLSWTIADAVEVAIEFDGYWVRTAKDAVICFDSPANWTRVTEGEPWAFWVDSAGALKAQQGAGGSELTLAAGDVTKISAIRGWKSAVIGHNDQGLIIGYIRSGTLRYRNYAEQETSPATWMWESEKDTTVAAINVGLARTNDFRTVFLYENGTGEVHWLVTARNWANMAIEDEKINAAITALSAIITPVGYNVIGDGPFDTDDPRFQETRGYYGSPNGAETIEAGITALPHLLLWAVETLPVHVENILSTAQQDGEDLSPASEGGPLAYQTMWIPLVEDSIVVRVGGVEQERGVDYTVNEATGVITFVSDPAPAIVSADYAWLSWGHLIQVTFADGILNPVGHQAQVTVENEALTAYTCTETSGGDPWADPIPAGRFPGTRQWRLRTANFNHPIGGTQTDLTVSYAANGLQGEAEQQVGSFSLSFTPVNLIAPVISLEAPEVEDLWNE